MDAYHCVCFSGEYGVKHGLFYCSGCRGTFCVCDSILNCCDSCGCYFCSKCTTSFMLKIPYCDCLVCRECSEIYPLHGTICLPYRKNLTAYIDSNINLPKEYKNLILKCLW